MSKSLAGNCNGLCVASEANHEYESVIAGPSQQVLSGTRWGADTILAEYRGCTSTVRTRVS